MMENRSCQTYGNTALAYRIDARNGEERNIIDYDIARRSYDARRRLARRQAAAAAERGQQGIERRPDAERRAMTLQDVLVESYQPERGVPEMLADIFSSLKTYIREHPFTYDLLHGDMRGRATHKATQRQVLASGTACMLLTMAVILIGS